MVKQEERFDEKEGRIVMENRLVAVTKPELHAKIHQPDNSSIEADILFIIMKQEVARNPSVPIGE